MPVTLKDPIERGLKVYNGVTTGLWSISYTQRPDRKGTERLLGKISARVLMIKLHSKTR